MPDSASIFRKNPKAVQHSARRGRPLALLRCFQRRINVGSCMHPTAVSPVWVKREHVHFIDDGACLFRIAVKARRAGEPSPSSAAAAISSRHHQGRRRCEERAPAALPDAEGSTRATTMPDWRTERVCKTDAAVRPSNGKQPLERSTFPE